MPMAPSVLRSVSQVKPPQSTSLPEGGYYRPAHLIVLMKRRVIARSSTPAGVARPGGRHKIHRLGSDRAGRTVPTEYAKDILLFKKIMIGNLFFHVLFFTNNTDAKHNACGGFPAARRGFPTGSKPALPEGGVDMSFGLDMCRGTRYSPDGDRYVPSARQRFRPGA